jgi:hypothetical protein
MSPLRWTCKSIRSLADTLQRLGHPASHRWVWATLHELNVFRQAEIPKKIVQKSPSAGGDFRLALLSHERMFHPIAFPLEQ